MANPLLDALLADRDGAAPRSLAPMPAATPEAQALQIDYATPLPEMTPSAPEQEVALSADPYSDEVALSSADPYLDQMGESSSPAPVPTRRANPLLDSLLADQQAAAQAAQQQATAQAVTEATTPDNQLPILKPELADALGVLDYRDPAEGQRRQQAAAMGEILNLPMWNRINLGAAPVNDDGTVTVRRAQAVSPEANAAAAEKMSAIQAEAAANLAPPSRPVEYYNRAERGARLGVEDVRSGFYSVVENFFKDQTNPYLYQSQATAQADVPKIEARLAGLQTRREEFVKGDLGPNRDRISPYDREISTLTSQLEKARQATTGEPVTEGFLGSLSRASGDLAAEARQNQAAIRADYTDKQITPERDKEFWMNVADGLGRTVPTAGAAILNPYLGLAMGYTQVYSNAEQEFDQAAAQAGKPIDPAARSDYAHSQALLQTPFEIVGDLALAKVARGAIEGSGQALIRAIRGGDTAAVSSFISALPQRLGQLGSAAAGETLITTPAQTVIEQKLAESAGVREPISNAQLAANTGEAMKVAAAQSLLLGGAPVALETGVTTVANRLQRPTAPPVSTETAPAAAPTAPAEVPQTFTPISQPAPAALAQAPRTFADLRVSVPEADPALVAEAFGPVAPPTPDESFAPPTPAGLSATIDQNTTSNMPEDQRAAETSGQPSRGGLDAKNSPLDSNNPDNKLNYANENIDSTSDRRPGNQADSSSAFFDASSEIDSGGSEATDRDSSRIRQTQSLVGWAQSRSSLIDPQQIDSLPLISNSTSEHEVHYRESDNRAVKRTWPGVYGQIPVPKNGKLDRANATPSEYLVRQGLQASVFGSDIRLEGVSFSDKPSMVLFEPPGQPSFVTSQEWFDKSEAPTLDEIADRLRKDGFVPVPNSYFGWFRPSDRVAIVDAKTDNFVKTPAGVIPLDLQMAVFTPEQVAEAGLDSFKNSAPSPGAVSRKPLKTDERGSVLIPSREDLIQAGQNLYKAGMDFAAWSGRMIQQFGEAVREFLAEVWKAVSGGNYLPQARERGSVNLGTPKSSGSKPRKLTQSLQSAPGVAPEVKSRLTAIDYDPVSNVETLAAARAQIDAAGSIDNAFISLMGKSAMEEWKPSAVDNAMGIELIGQLQGRGRYDDAASVANFLSKRATDQGRAIQALSLVSRLTPQGIELFASKQIEAAAQKDPRIKQSVEDSQRLKGELTNVRRTAGTNAIVNNLPEIKGNLPAGTDAVAVNMALREAILQSPTPTAAEAAIGQVLRDNGTSDKASLRIGRSILRDYLKTSQDARAKLLQDLFAVAEADRRLNKGKLADLTRLNAEGSLTDNKLHTHIGKMLGVPVWTSDHSAKVQRLIKERDSAEHPSVKLVKGAEILDVIYRESMPPGLAAKVDAVQTLAMLLFPKTWIRNIAGNAVMFGGDLAADTVALAADAAVSIGTGKRTRTGLDIATRLSGLGAGVEDMKAGYDFARSQGAGRLGSFKEGVQTLIRMGRLYSSGKYDAASITQMTGSTFASGPLRVLEDTLGVALSLADRGFYESAFRSSLENRMRTAKANGQDLIAPDPDMIAAARMDAGRAVYQDENRVSKILSGLRRVLNVDQRWGLGSMLLKFTQVPGSILTKGVEFSPLGFIRNAYQILAPVFSKRAEFDQKAFADAFSRAFVGTTGLVATGYWLAHLGILSGGSGKEDEDKRNLDRAQGWGDYKLNVSALKRALMTGNFWTRQKRQLTDTVISWDWAQPLSIAVAMGADAREQQDKMGNNVLKGKHTSLAETGMNWMAAAAGIATGAMNSLVEQPLLTGLNKFMRDASFQNLPGAVISTVADMPKTFIPAAVRGWMQFDDNTVRETRDGTSDFRQYVNELKSQLPGLSQTLPPKRDITGTDVERWQGNSNTIFNVLFNPAIVTRIKQSPVLTEMSKVYEVTANTSAVASIAKPEFTLEGVKVRLTAEEVSAMQKEMGALSVAAVEKFVLDDPRYAKASWDAKASAMTKALELAAKSAKYRVLMARPDLKSRAFAEYQAAQQAEASMQQTRENALAVP